jgi:hypothetical protein
MESFSGLEKTGYLDDLALAAALSPLFSESKTPFIHSRLAERLFCMVSGNHDLARQDLSYDAKSTGGIGVGVKTFVSNSASASKVEKVAEFTAFATKGAFNGLSGEALALKVSHLRNARVASDAAETEISIENSYYHCVVRVPNGIYLLEQPYSQVSVGSLKPTDKFGREVTTFADSGHVYFNDGSSDYAYNVAKNVLYKRFSPTQSFASAVIHTKFDADLPSLLLKLKNSNLLTISSVNERVSVEEPENAEEFVILPLYSPRTRTVASASGINQWNAAGRIRTFGEAYIPVPRAVHDLAPGFFPERDQPFRLRLPNGEVIVAKICQDGSKALMANPNTDLCKWLFATIDGSFEISETRLVESRPYVYSDLELIGKDSVKVTKVSGQQWDFEIQSASLGSYEEFLDA